jgi:hypothetical protein
MSGLKQLEDSLPGCLGERASCPPTLLQAGSPQAEIGKMPILQ